MSYQFDQQNFAYSPGAAGGFGRLWRGGFGDDPTYEVTNDDGTTDIYDSTTHQIIQPNIYGTQPDPTYYPTVNDPGVPIYSGGATPAPAGGDSGGSNNPPWWSILGPGILKDISNIFAPVQTSVAQAQSAGLAQRQLQAGLTPQQYQLLQTGATTGVGIGIDSNGIRLSDGSHISWILIIGLIVVFALVQSRGFQRR